MPDDNCTRGCPCQVEYQDYAYDEVPVTDEDVNAAFRKGYDTGYMEASARWSADYQNIRARLSQIRELAR